jgi:hypothetical protein
MSNSNPTADRFKEQEESLRQQEVDTNLQFIVLLTLIIEKIEFLEQRKYVFGNIKSFLKNSKTKYEQFIAKVFEYQGSIEGNDAKQATNKLLVMQERVELALENKYVLTVDERRERAAEILSKYMIAPMVDKAMEEMEFRNLFNF